MLVLAGCGYSGGEALFMSGLFHRPKVKAAFKLGNGPVAVIVDDFQELCTWPEAPSMLESAIVDQLGLHRAAAHLVSPTKIKRLRQSYPEFDRRGFRELGRMLDADRVLAVAVRSFHASVDVQQVSAAARMSVAVKVIDCGEHVARGRVRLWPTSRAGEPIAAELDAATVTRARTRHAILLKLTAALAEKVAAKFYDRPMPDFERE